MSNVSFADLSLCPSILRALEVAKYTTPTPIQAAAIPPLLLGRDLLGCAQTGTGKTAAFALPILQRLQQNTQVAQPRSPRVLVLAPTRELAAQIVASFADYGRYLRLKHLAVFGGVSQVPQVRALSRGVHVLVATPGRLLDLMQQGFVRLDRLETFVLDEADRMLDMGFLPDLRRIAAALPRQRQSLFFSATMPATIAHLAESLLSDPVRVAVTPVASTVEGVQQRVLHVGQTGKRDALNELLGGSDASRVLVFTRTKRRADHVVHQLSVSGIQADAIHGNKSQSARERALQRFRMGHTRVLVATDIAARGIDVEGISHVINYDLPHEPESYVHRIGRTARAGAVGVAVSFCEPGERGSLRAIERLIGKTFGGDSGAAQPAVRGASSGRTVRPASGRSGSKKPASAKSAPPRRSKPAFAAGL